MASSSGQADAPAPAGPSKPRSNPWASTSTPPAKPAWGASSSQPSSSSTSAGFPTLSSSSSHPTRKRDRGTPWKPAPRQSYPSRLQEIQARALERRAREDEAQLLQETSASSPPRIMTIDELNGSTTADGHEVGEDADFYRGPAQMYGMSRVVVRDLSEAAPGKGKGKNKVRGQDVSGGPQVYARHNAPWVQRAKRGREEGGVGEDEVVGEVASSSIDAEVGVTPPLAYAATATLSLEEVVAAYHRATRIQAAQRRAAEAPSTSSPPVDLLAPVIEKLRYDIEIGKPLSSVPAVLASLPQDAVARCITAIGSSVTASAPRRSPAALWQLLRLCLSLDFDSDEAVEVTRSAWEAVLRALHAHGAEGKPVDMQDEKARSLVARLLAPLNAGIAQAYRLSGPPPLLGHLAHALHLLRLAHPRLPASTFYCSQLDDPRALDMLCSLDDDDDSSTYAFLLPLSSTKLRLISGEAQRIAEEARKQRLWASFYSPSQRHEGEHGEDRNTPPRLRVRRTHVFEDTLSALQDPHNELAWQHGVHLNVSFVGEEGVDSVLGGLRREWLSLLVAELVKKGVLREAEEGDGGVIVLSEGSSEEYAKVLGLAVGMALLLGEPCGFRLACSTVRTMLREEGEEAVRPDTALEDLNESYPTLARNLRVMLDWQPAGSSSSSSEADADADADATFHRTFSLNWTTISWAGLPISLISGGQHRPVTLSNRHAYAQALAMHRLYGSVRAQLKSACQGFSLAWPARSRAWLHSWLAEEELVSLVEGPTSIDVRLLRRTVQVVNQRRDGGDRLLLNILWDAVERLQAEDDAFAEKLLAFITGSPRLPLSFLAAGSGSARLPAPFAIHLIDEDSLSASLGSLPLPWASTCTMTLFLPRGYARVGTEELAERLRRSVELGVEGFGLK